MSEERSPQSSKVARAQWVIVGLFAASLGLALVSEGSGVQVLSAVLLWVAGVALIFTLLMRWLGPWRERR